MSAAPYRVECPADGIEGRASIMDADGREVMRLRNLTPDQAKAFAWLATQTLSAHHSRQVLLDAMDGLYDALVL